MSSLSAPASVTGTATASTTAPAAATTDSATPLVLPAAKAALWLLGTALIALAVYYFVGVDQGAYSVFGKDTHVHEFVHDARHFLGFPCH
ncbi:CbtB-domain containing protein [Streptomyces sp. HPF1205]|uniref:CbtB domain-containing protein n=1 Tax=Streptomyces sp. HPF1205 TaxID=2873262 RepID=UPI0035ABB2EC